MEWCRKRGVEFYAVNRDYPEETMQNNNHFSRKLKADYFIDDRNIGGLPDWGQIYQMVHDNLSWYDVLRQRQFGDEEEKPKRKKKWGIF